MKCIAENEKENSTLENQIVTLKNSSILLTKENRTNKKEMQLLIDENNKLKNEVDSKV